MELDQISRATDRGCFRRDGVARGSPTREGVGNALRSLYSDDASGLPWDMAKLLDRLR